MACIKNLIISFFPNIYVCCSKTGIYSEMHFNKCLHIILLTISNTHFIEELSDIFLIQSDKARVQRKDK